MIFALLIITVIMAFWQYNHDENNYAFSAYLIGNFVAAVLYAGLMALFSNFLFGSINIDWTGANASGIPTGIPVWGLLIVLWILSVGRELFNGKISENSELVVSLIVNFYVPILWTVIFFILQLIGIVTVKWI